MCVHEKISNWGYKKFQTEKNKYIYDTYTNRVAQVDENVYETIDLIVENSHSNICEDKIEIIANTKEAVECYQNDENMFQPLPFQDVKFIETNHLKTWERNRLILNVTDDCNLRCDYCIYTEAFPHEYRSFSRTQMSFQTAKLAVDDFLVNSTGRVSINFYGGEPLICYNLIKDVVRYIHSNYGDTERVLFTITTNGALLTSEMLRYFLDSNIMLSVSIDGPAYIHDKYRKDKNGTGSHKYIVDALRAAKAYDADKYKQLVSFQATLNPDLMPINEVIEYFSSDELFSSNTVSLNDMEVPEDGFAFLPDSENESNNSFWPEVLEFAEQNGSIEPTSRTKIIMRYYLSRIYFLHKRLSSKVDLSTGIPLNGCCVPGQSRLFVSVSGEYHVCEKIGEHSESIGNPQNGLQFSKALEYMRSYKELSLEKCQNCWAMHLCGLCYTSLFNSTSKSFSTKDKKKYCGIERASVEDNLVRLMELMEVNPNFVEEYSDNS